MNPSHAKQSEEQVSATKGPVSRRGRSFSFSSSSLLLSSSSMSSNVGSPLFPAVPLRLSGVPFSWEEHPGIPKEIHCPTSKTPSPSCQDLFLPLPPPAVSASSPSMTTRKKKVLLVPEIDPFMAALAKCSRDHLHLRHSRHVEFEEDRFKGAKVSRSLSDRWRSCKRTCSVVEPTVLLNRQGYHLLDRR